MLPYCVIYGQFQEDIKIDKILTIEKKINPSSIKHCNLWT